MANGIVQRLFIVITLVLSYCNSYCYSAEWRSHYVCSQFFGHRIYYTGTDLVDGETTLAIEEGKVLKTGWYGPYGRVIIVTHSTGSTLYSRLSRCFVQSGDLIKQGQVIGIYAKSNIKGKPLRKSASDESVLTGKVETEETSAQLPNAI